MYGASNIDKNGGSHAAAQAITDMWYYSEVNLYPQSAYGRSNPDMGGFHDWGHYTQVVWKNTAKVGCASKLCPAGTIVGGMASWYTVCNYHPAGMHRPLSLPPPRPVLTRPCRQLWRPVRQQCLARPRQAPCLDLNHKPDTRQASGVVEKSHSVPSSCVMHQSSNREQAQSGRRVAWKRKYHRSRGGRPFLFPDSLLVLYDLVQRKIFFTDLFLAAQALFLSTGVVRYLRSRTRPRILHHLVDCACP